MHTTKGNLHKDILLCEHGADEVWRFVCECGWTDGYEYDTSTEVIAVAKEHVRQQNEELTRSAD